ncbi:hydantoinase B/oxoprolinase family protein [Aurantivibrio plasticivorans]
MNPIALSLFASRIAAVCDEMGALLRRTAFSPNIKDRLDFSCAVFDKSGKLCAQAAHIPVHLGSMAYAMADIVSQVEWLPGDQVVVNDPYLGGTHLPDVTVIAPVFVNSQLLGFVANRAHHANIGASSPGSMPISSRLEEEGVVIPPTHIQREHILVDHVMNQLVGDEDNRQARGDFTAQLSANRLGQERLQALIEESGAERYQQHLVGLNAYGEQLARAAISEIPDGQYSFTDYMDDDGLGQTRIPISVQLSIAEGTASLDFKGTAAQVEGNINCPLPVTAAAVFYVFRCLMSESTPACAGTFKPIHISAQKGSLINAERPHAVAAGNVETSSRLVDVVLGALAQAIPDKIPAASQGTMNNVAMGAHGTGQWPRWDYYETIGGGMGGSAIAPGLSGVQSHMTNTLNTPH